MSDYFNVRLFGEVFITLFVIMDPPGIVPVYLGLTRNMTAKARHTAANQAAIAAFGIILGFAIFGNTLLDYLSVSLPALQFAGGLLLLMIAVQLITGKDDEFSVGEHGSSIAISPLAIPLLAGPGAIVAAMVFVQQSHKSVADWAAILVAAVAVHVCLWLSMRFADVIAKALGTSGVTLITRVAGLLLSAIAIQMGADAVTSFVRAA